MSKHKHDKPTHDDAGRPIDPIIDPPIDPLVGKPRLDPITGDPLFDPITGDPLFDPITGDPLVEGDPVVAPRAIVGGVVTGGVQFIHGNPTFTPFNNGATPLTAGDVIELGDLLGVAVAHHDIAANVTVPNGVAFGGGYYQGQSLEGPVMGAHVYWDQAVKKFTTVSTTNPYFGQIAEIHTAGANGQAIVFHIRPVP